MRIAINAASVGSKKTGIGNYILGLIRALGIIDTENQYVIFYNGSYPPIRKWHAKTLGDKSNFEAAYLSNLERHWNQICLPTELRKRHINVYHEPSFVLPLIRPCPTVVTFHDATSIIFPENLGEEASAYFHKWSGISAKNADVVLCNSLNTANDLMKYYQIKEDKIIVAKSAADPIYRKLDEVDRGFLKEQYSIRSRYILYVGTIEIRKNVDRMLKAFCFLKQKYGVEHQFLLVGKVRPNFDVVKNISELGLENEVILAGYVKDEVMPLLYNGADLFVYVSLYEGFGLPPLEAMHCGTPVVTSNVSSLPEVAGEAAITVNPYEINKIAEAMYKVISDQVLSNTLINKGFERAKLFSWEKVARQTKRAYERIINYAEKE